MRMSCVDPPGGVQLQRSNVKAGFDTVDNGDSNILAFCMKSHRGSVVIQEIGPCQGGEKRSTTWWIFCTPFQSTPLLV